MPRRKPYSPKRNNCAFTWRRCKSRAATSPASRSSWTALSNSCPPGPQLSNLTRQLDKVAKDSHVDLVNVTPGQPAPFLATVASPPGKAAAKPSATTPTAGVAASSATAGSGLMAIPIGITASGDYFNLERFLDSLEGLQRSMLVDGFTVTYQPPKTGAPSATPQIGSGELTVNIQTRVFLTAALSASWRHLTSEPARPPPTAAS